MSDEGNDNIFGGYQDRFKPKGATATKSPAPPPDDAPASTRFNASRERTQIMLDLRFKNGDRFSLAYSFLIAVGFDKSAITLEFSGYRVALQGVRLDDIYRGLITHQIGSVQEVDETSHKMTGDSKAPAIYRITKENLRS
jgi:hypothetical protein